MCPSSAINMRDQAKFKVDLGARVQNGPAFQEGSGVGLTCNCVALFAPVCANGVCTAGQH